MAERGRVLVVDDEPSMRDTLRKGFARRDFAVTLAASAEEACSALRGGEHDAVLTDLRLGSTDGIALIGQAHAIQPNLPVLVMTAFGSLDTAILAIRAGAYDFVTKPLDVDVAMLALDRAVQYKRLNAEMQRLREEARGFESSGQLLGESAVMQEVTQLVARVAMSESTALIMGESGTGKEVVARSLHRLSGRSAGPFVAVNCAALPEALLESELFGHVKGAFTDAKANRSGLFAQASGGTLFLDEMGELPLSMQAKLLRALEERTIRPIGSDRELSVDVRIIAATNRDLRALADEGRFREDLYFRLAVIEIDLPPLRARGHDVLLIAQHELVKRAARASKAIRGFAPDAARLLLTYEWPGNVRELQNTVERAIAMARFDLIAPEDLPQRVRAEKRAANPVSLEFGEELVPLEQIEQRYVAHVLRSVDGHRAQAAKILGLDRKTLYRKLEQWGKEERNSEG
jgi:two-component system response regulator AtoC